ncbi:cell cycle checkpoint control protein RAD9A isoform X1 [Macrosteles quadrilineatus]|uniref:cell cycle checkpoint control protein RAD9A isoform X1 n=1 Tax=Macrosteles quadrilineatus TaxID=74068 RepID=UPI0023E3199E|nr:cell cycle checkpoint control protein RAD9A isoform X1 [Macrosteles quadrilineatus]
MKCVVPSQNVKILAKAFHSLGKIGDDLFIEPHPDHIAFRTVNMAESAYAYFIFTKLFFSSFLFAEEDNEDGLRCKIAMKSLLAIFKFPHGDRLIEWCQLRLDTNDTKVIFQMRYSYGCTKTYFLPIMDNETLQANYSKDDCHNRLSTSPKLLSTAVKNFRYSENEVTLCLMSRKLIMRNHLDNILDSKKAVRTEISLYADEFESYSTQAETSITFCLQELKAVLFFAEFTALPVQFYINQAGKPVVFVVKNESLYEANYVVSTLSESGTSQQLSQMSDSSATTSTRGPANPKKRPLEERNNVSQPKRVPSPHCTAPLSVGNFSQISGVAGMSHSVLSADHSQLSVSESNITQPVVRSVFPRCFETTFHRQSLPGYNNVLVYDSDGIEDSD